MGFSKPRIVGLMGLSPIMWEIMGVTRLQHKKTAHKQINCIQTDKLIRNGFANCNLDKSYASQQLGFQQKLSFRYTTLPPKLFPKKNQQNTDFPSLFPKKINNKIY